MRVWASCSPPYTRPLAHLQAALLFLVHSHLQNHFASQCLALVKFSERCRAGVPPPPHLNLGKPPCNVLRFAYFKAMADTPTQNLFSDSSTSDSNDTWNIAFVENSDTILHSLHDSASLINQQHGYVAAARPAILCARARSRLPPQIDCASAGLPHSTLTPA